MKTLLAVLLAAFALSACATGDQPQRAQQQPRDGRAGLQLSGTVASSHVAVSDGRPDLIVGDCPGIEASAEDVCVVARDLRGQLVTLAVRNPAVLVEGERVRVDDPECVSPMACSDVSDAAVVDVVVGEQPRQRAVGGVLAMTVVEERARYAGRVDLELPDGRLSGHFDVVPRPDE